MKLSEFRTHLSSNPSHGIRFRLPDGSFLAAHAHVSEVARIEKQFIDCGGVFRTEVVCRLQTWVADDLEHRLSAGKLLGILDKAANVLRGEDMEVDIEHEVGFVTQMPLGSVQVDGQDLILALTHRHTDCLAQDRCRPAVTGPQSISLKPLSRRN